MPTIIPQTIRILSQSNFALCRCANDRTRARKSRRCHVGLQCHPREHVRHTRRHPVDRHRYFVRASVARPRRNAARVRIVRVVLRSRQPVVACAHSSLLAPPSLLTTLACSLARVAEPGVRANAVRRRALLAARRRQSTTLPPILAPNTARTGTQPTHDQEFTPRVTFFATHGQLPCP